MIQWILLALASLAAGVAIALLLFSAKRTPIRSRLTSSAEAVSLADLQLDLVDLRSTVTGLSSTLRKLHGRESQRLRKDSGTSSHDLLSDKNALRQRYGVVPRTADLDAD